MEATSTTPPLPKPPIPPPSPLSDDSLVDVPVQSRDLPPESAKLTENIGVSPVQPPRKPEEPATPVLSARDVVDAFYEDAWRKGVVKQVVEGGDRFAVSFDEESDELVEFRLDDLKLHWDLVDGSWTRPAEKAAVALMYEVGGKIEVSRDNGKPHYSWFKASVLEPMKFGCLTVEYLVKVGIQSQACRATVDRASVRPCPPTLYIKSFVLWEKVDAYWDCGWWIGVITKVLKDLKYEVFVQQLKKTKVFHTHQLRTHMEYKGGNWFISSQDSALSQTGGSSERNPERLMKNFRTSLEDSVDASTQKTTEVVMLDGEESIIETSHNLELVAPAIEENNEKHSTSAMKSSCGVVYKNLVNPSIEPCMPISMRRWKTKLVQPAIKEKQPAIKEKNKKHSTCAMKSSYGDKILVNPNNERCMPISKRGWKTAKTIMKSSKKFRSTAPKLRPIALIPGQTAPNLRTIAPAIEENNEKQPKTVVHTSCKSVGQDMVNQSVQQCLPSDEPNVLWKSIETIMESSQKLKTIAPALNDQNEKQPETVVQSSYDSVDKILVNPSGQQCLPFDKSNTLLKANETTTESSHKHGTTAPATEENNVTLPETVVQSSNDEVDNNLVSPSGQEVFPLDKANPLWKLIETITESSENLETVAPTTEKNNDKQPETVPRSSSDMVDKILTNESGQRSLRLDEVFNKSQLRLHMKSNGGKWVISSQDGTLTEPGASSGGRYPGGQMGNLRTPAKGARGLLIKRNGQPSSRTDKASSSRDPVDKILVNRSKQRACTSYTPVVSILVPGKAPFEKASPLWKTIESMDVFKRLPQKPHFRPLLQEKKNARETKAIGLMVNFSNVAERVSKLQFSDAKSVTSDILSTLTELGTHGFDVTSVLDCVINFRSLRDKWENFVNDVKKLEDQISVHSSKRRRVESDISETNKEMRKLKEKLSRAQLVKDHEDGEIAFLEARLLEVKEGIRNVEQESHGT